MEGFDKGGGGIQGVETPVGANILFNNTSTISRDLCRGDHCRVVFCCNITPFKKAAKDSLPIPRQYKQIHFVLGKFFYSNSLIQYYIKN